VDREAFYREALEGPGPLAGVRVVELATTWAGPMCGCLLADLGADVIKVEHPDGEVGRRLPPFLPGADPPLSFMHATLNRGKRSVALDLHDAAQRDTFLALAATADVLVENFRPGVLERFGVGYADVRRVRADVVYVSISGWGQFGPDRERAGYDPLAQATGGFMSLNGAPAGDPVKSPTFLADDLAGVHAALAALAALRHRDRTGEGQHVDISLLDALLFQSSGYPTLAAMGVDLPRLGNQFRIAAPANAYRARDGWVMLGVLLDGHWKKLARLIGHPELADHPDWAGAPARIDHRAESDALVAAWVAEREVAEVVDLLVRAELPAAPVRSYAEAVRDPHVRARETLQTVRAAEGVDVPLVAPVPRMSRTPLRLRGAAPALDAHGEEVLAELGRGAGTPAPPPAIRPAGRDDAPALRALIAGFRDELGSERPSDAELARHLAASLAHPDLEFACAFADDGAGIGYTQMRFFPSVWAAGTEAFLEDLFVVPRARGGGVGRGLLDFALARARARGARILGLNTNERNEPAMRLYRGAGFRVSAEPRWGGGREVRWSRRL
jgi:formyl-CoA transferase